MPGTWYVTSFYKFLPVTEETLPSLCDFLRHEGDVLELCGLILLAPEGVNGTVAGQGKTISMFKKLLVDEFGELEFKDSTCDVRPFKRYKVDVRDEIVAIGDPTLHPRVKENDHLPVAEWNTILEQEDAVLLDTRNTYETALGKFKNAIDPQLSHFSEFPAFVQKCTIPKDKKILMYCTGGIRCEKAALEMRRQGYQHVYQLDGGILKYLEESPYRAFEGECFVFDHRVAVNQELEPSSRYKLCPHCGDPGDKHVACLECGTEAVICATCEVDVPRRTCSLNCQYHTRRKALNATSELQTTYE
ncbi:MAG: hypothetical protein JWM56_1281 [Candidatus Peribacteria bacterium]|nr:hypothetical protein [Candidatus Peribacteria bacterium]